MAAVLTHPRLDDRQVRTLLEKTSCWYWRTNAPSCLGINYLKLVWVDFYSGRHDKRASSWGSTIYYSWNCSVLCGITFFVLSIVNAPPLGLEWTLLRSAWRPRDKCSLVFWGQISYTYIIPGIIPGTRHQKCGTTFGGANAPPFALHLCTHIFMKG